MNKTEIKIQNKQYPVVFNIQTIINFEKIAKRGFFGDPIEALKDRIAIIIASVLSADENTDLTVATIMGKQDLSAVKDIFSAFSAVMELVGDFFDVPEVMKQEDTQQKNPLDEQKNA